VFVFSFVVTEKASAVVITGSLPYTVVAENVDVKVNNVQGPITVSVGDSVYVEWTSTNASSCRCRCVNPNNESEEISCGNTPYYTGPYPNDRPSCGIGAGGGVTSTPAEIKNIVQPIKFKVTCPDPNL
jgi:hypothetical protein